MTTHAKTTYRKRLRFTIRIAAEGFLCEAKHKQGDLVEVREGFARHPDRRREPVQDEKK